MPHLTSRNKIFSSGDPLAGGFDGNVTGDPFNLDATPVISVLNADGENYDNYAFLFWNVQGEGGGISKSLHYHLNPFTHDITATAWYTFIGGGNGIAHYVSTVAFSQSQDSVVTDTPVQSVNPAASWAGGDATTVSTETHSVDITPRNAVPTAGGETFDSWLIFGPATVNGLVLHAEEDEYDTALAYYAVHKSNIRPGDFGRFIDEMSRLKNLIDQIADPSPEIWRNVVEAFKEAEEIKAKGNDELSNVLANIDILDKNQLKARMVELNARVSRLNAAQKMLSEAVKNLDVKKNINRK